MPRRLEARPVLRARAELGESPRWDDRTGRLLWVDILRGELHSFDPESGADELLADAGRHLGAAAPARDGGFAAAVREGVDGLLDDGGVPHVAFLADEPGLRTNDARADRAGRFWVGVIAYDSSPGRGGLYRVEPDGALHLALAGTWQANGLDWTPDDRTFYFVDTLEYAIDAFDYDAASGEISERRRFLTTRGERGRPDGICVDTDGGVWVGFYGAGAVHRYTPGGELDVVVEIPGAEHVTSPAFGGPALNRLFVTTATEGLDADGLARQPHAGDLFVVDDAGRRGQPTAAFAG